MKIWVDNDACPVAIKDIILKASHRLQVAVVLVANRQMEQPRHQFVSVITVAKGADIADQHIVDQLVALDIVVTADIPLADAAVTKGATAINPRGDIYTLANIKERLGMRDFLTDLRDSGMMSGGGPAPFGTKERQKFANALDKTLTQNLAKRP